MRGGGGKLNINFIGGVIGRTITDAIKFSLRGLWRRGWHHCGTHVRVKHFRETVKTVWVVVEKERECGFPDLHSQGQKRG